MNRPLVLGTAALAVVVCGLAWSGAAGQHSASTNIKASAPTSSHPSGPTSTQPSAPINVQPSPPASIRPLPPASIKPSVPISIKPAGEQASPVQPPTAHCFVIILGEGVTC